MTEKLNFYSLFICLICWLSFLILGFSNIGTNIIQSMSPSSAWYILLGLTVISFILSVIGFKGIKNKMTMFRSFLTVFLNVILISFELFIIFMGKMLG